MSSPTKGGGSASSAHRSDHSPPTIAAFSPSTSLHSPSATKQRSTILVHQKSPLLVATPPQVTRALAYSHPFIAPLNRLAGLISWTTPDPWESFLLLAAFWTCTLYGDFIIRWAGPLLGVAGLILGMYARRYSPLSSTGWGSDSIAGRNRSDSELLKHHKSLDEIVDTMKLFTSRCNILLDPFLRMTDFLSTQRTATSATTRPALTSMFIRILLVTPIWCFLTLPPFYIITTKRVILAVGTVSLTWHSRPARVCRIILWRSRLLRGICTTITGLSFPEPEGGKSENNLSPHLQMAKKKTAHEVAASLAARRNTETPGIRFTFSLYENQRRWLGIGWTSSMLAYERGSWTDEHLNATVPKERFDLPEVDGGHAKWRWVKGSEWHLERTEDEAVAIKAGNDTEDGSWIYYDNKWKDGRRGRDGWGRYTRRRKWCRDAELIEVTPSTEVTPSATPKPGDLIHSPPSAADSMANSEHSTLVPGASSARDDTDASSSQARRRGWFRRSSQTASDQSTAITTLSTSSTRSRDDEDDDLHPQFRRRENEGSWGVSDDVQMELG